MLVASILWAESVCAEYSQQQPNPDDCAEDTVPLSDLTSLCEERLLYCIVPVLCEFAAELEAMNATAAVYYLMAVVMMMQL